MGGRAMLHTIISGDSSVVEGCDRINQRISRCIDDVPLVD